MINVPKYMLAMLVVTGLYLTVEIPFSIYLVRILGGMATEADIDTVEKFGRLLTGIAVALAYVGIRIYPRYHGYGYSFLASTRQAVFRIVPIVVLVYVGLHVYGEVRGMFAGGDERKEAFISNLAKRTLAEDGLNGLAPSNDPSWLATVSSMPVLLSATNLVALTGLSVDELSRREAKRSVGDAEQAREAFAKELEAKIASAYDQFSKASDQYRTVNNGKGNHAEWEWNNYRARLSSHFGNKLPRPGSSYHSRVIKELRQGGMNVPAGYRLDDKSTFITLAVKKIIREAANEFAKGIDWNVGKGSKLLPGADKSTFYADPAVQRQIRDRMSRMNIAAGVVLSPDMSLETFRQAVYPSLLKRAAGEILDTANMKGSSFTSQVNSASGEAAVKAATLPSTALLLSLAGALFHIHKFSGYLMLIFGTALRSRMLASKFSRHVFAATSLALVVLAMQPAIPAHMGDVYAKSEGSAYGQLVTAAVSLQPGLFSIGEAMAANGPWQLIGHHLPEARLPAGATTSATPENVLSADNSLPAPMIETAEADNFTVPIPTPRPQ